LIGESKQNLVHVFSASLFFLATDSTEFFEAKLTSWIRCDVEAAKVIEYTSLARAKRT
jgi:hypothetical protein